MSDLQPGDAKRLTALAISETGFLFDPRTGHSYTANATALAAISGLQRGQSIADIGNQLRANFEIDGAEVEEDLVEFVRVLRDHGLLPASSSRGGAA